MLDTHFLPYNSKSFVLHSIFTRIHQPASIQLLRSKTQWSFYSLFPHPIVSRFIAQRANAEPGCSEVKTARLSEFWKLDLKRKKKWRKQRAQCCKKRNSCFMSWRSFVSTFTPWSYLPAEISQPSSSLFLWWPYNVPLHIQLTCRLVFHEMIELWVFFTFWLWCYCYGLNKMMLPFPKWPMGYEGQPVPGREPCGGQET